MNFAEATRALHSNGVDSQGGASRFDPAVLWSVLVATSSCGFLRTGGPYHFERHISSLGRSVVSRPPTRKSAAPPRAAVQRICRMHFWRRYPCADAARTVADGVTIFFLDAFRERHVCPGRPSRGDRGQLALRGRYSVDFVHGILKRAINTPGHFFGFRWATRREPRAGTAEPAAQHRLALASTWGNPVRAPPSSRNTEDVSTRVDDRTSRVRPKAGLRDNGTKRLQHQRRGLIERIELPGSPSMLTEEMR